MLRDLTQCTIPCSVPLGGFGCFLRYRTDMPISAALHSRNIECPAGALAKKSTISQLRGGGSPAILWPSVYGWRVSIKSFIESPNGGAVRRINSRFWLKITGGERSTSRTMLDGADSFASVRLTEPRALRSPRGQP